MPTATGTQANDKTETAAIRAVFRAAEQIPISATKAMHGHLLGAGRRTGMRAVVAGHPSMRLALPTMHLQQPDPECDLDYVANRARDGVWAR